MDNARKSTSWHNGNDNPSLILSTVNPIILQNMVAPATNNLDKLASQSVDNQDKSPTVEASEPILCPHCRRTASNGIKCKGICVADSDY